MDERTVLHRNDDNERISRQDRDEIVRSLAVIRRQGRLLQRSLEAASVDEADLVARLQVIEQQTRLINMILIDANDPALGTAMSDPENDPGKRP